MTPKVNLVADDLVGAVDASVASAERAPRVSLSPTAAGGPSHSSCVVVLNTDTDWVAYVGAAALRSTLSDVESATHVVKKVDPALRGHESLETSVLREFFPRRTAVVALALSAARRRTSSGIRCVHDQRHDRTAILDDHAQNVAGRGEVTAALARIGANVAVFDALDATGLTVIAHRGLTVPAPAVWVCSGALADELLPRERITTTGSRRPSSHSRSALAVGDQRRRTVAIIGSASLLACRQAHELAQFLRAPLTELEASKSRGGERVRSGAIRLGRTLAGRTRRHRGVRSPRDPNRRRESNP